jgi:hypothetical protein
VDGAPAVAEFEVLSRRATPDGERLEVRQRTRVVGLESEQVRTYAEGVGLVAARGRCPDPDPGVTYGFRAEVWGAPTE